MIHINKKKKIIFNQKHFLFRINPVLKIIFFVLMLKIIFSLNVDFLQKQNIFFFFLPFIVLFLVLFSLLMSIRFPFGILFRKIFYFKFFFIFSFLMGISYQDDNLNSFSFHVLNISLNNYLKIFFCFMLFFYFFLKKQLHKKFYWFFILFLFFILPYFQKRLVNFSFMNNFTTIDIYIEKTYLLKIFLILIRILFILMINILFVQTTSFIEVNDGLFIFLKPLKKIKFPTEVFSLMISLIFISIPFLLETTNKVLKSQVSRGLNFYTKNLFKKIYYFVSLLIPIFILSFKKSFVLANAMETRGYILGNSRTQLNKYKITQNDYIILFFVLGFFVLSFYF